MPAAQSPITFSGDLFRPKTAGRIPLQPKNTPCINAVQSKPKPKSEKFVPVSPISCSNKENNPDYSSPVEIEVAIDASLAEELNAVRKRLERLRLDKEKTERMLRERDRIFQIQMEELRERGEFQKELEIEVDRLYRLKQLQIHCMRMSPIRSLREREMQRRSSESPSQSQSSMVKEVSPIRRLTLMASSTSESTSDV